MMQADQRRQIATTRFDAPDCAASHKTFYNRMLVNSQ